MLKAVIFDFGQTLVDSADGFRTAENEAQFKLFSNLGLTIRHEFLANYRKLRKAFHERSNFSRKSLWQEVYHYYCLSPDIDFIEKWENEYWETVKSHSKLFPEAEQVLEALSSRYDVALITNTQGQIRIGTHRISQFPELEKYFKVIIVAGEEGIPPKPDPKPFQLCLDELSIEASEAIYIGDDYRIDICGAKDAGLHPIWLKHYSVKRNWPDVKTNVPIITRLDELLELDGIIY